MNRPVLSQHIIDAMDPADRSDLGLECTAERVDRAVIKCEDDLQRVIEQFCVLQGFERLTPENIKRAAVDEGFPRRGWQFHLSKFGAKKNPKMPDVTLFDVNSGKYLWLELKVTGGKPDPLQAILIERGHWKLAYTKEAAADIIIEFINSLEGRK